MNHKLWQSHHRSDYLIDILFGLKQILHTPITSLIIVWLVAFSLFLFASFYEFYNSKKVINNVWNKSAGISLYLKKKTDIKTTTALVEKLGQNPLVAEIQLIKPDEGIKAFTENSTINMLLSGFKENPLPTVIIIYPKLNLLTKNVTQNFIEELKNQTKVEIVKADSQWIGQSHSWLTLLDKLSLLFIWGLGINTIFIIYGISSAATKIFIAKDTLSKTALPYQFAWLSLISGLLALLLCNILTTTIQEQDILIQHLNITSKIFIVLGSLFLGFMGAQCAVRRGTITI